ncbi:hypothetical protein Tco_1190458, partial [Tanacetum coccineum]
LSQRFWGEAMLTSCYLLNRVPNKRNMITPYELWIKRKPNLNYLRVWGCRAVVRLPDPKLKTLGKRGIKCIFVGYAEHSKAFRFYVIEPNNSVAINLIIESKDAIFDENIFSSVLRPSLNILKETKDISGSVVPEVVTDEIMPPTMMTQSAGRPAAASRGVGTGGRAGRGGGRTRGSSRDQGDGRNNGPGGQVGGQGSKVNGGVGKVPDFSTIIAQQLHNLLPTIVAQVGDQGRGQGDGRNQNGDAVNDHIQGDVRNAIEGNDLYTRWVEKMESVQDMSGCRDNQRVKYSSGSFVGKALTWWNSEIRTRGREAVVETELWNHAMVGAGHATYTDRFHELARLVPHLVTSEGKKIERYVYGLSPQIRGMVAATEPKTIQKAVQLAGTLTDEALRNGSIKKNPEKRGNVGEPSMDRNEREDNKRTRTGNAFCYDRKPC